jgi:hypothetical protein
MRCAVVATGLLLILAGCGSSPPEPGPVFDNEGGAALTCMKHQPVSPGARYTDPALKNTVEIFTVLRYYTANGNKPYCDQGQKTSDRHRQKMGTTLPHPRRSPVKHRPHPQPLTTLGAATQVKTLKQFRTLEHLAQVAVGRDRRRGWPPAQIPACGTTALGSCLGCELRNAFRERDAPCGRVVAIGSRFGSSVFS